MDTVGAFEAKTHLPRLLDRVARGESVTITRHGRPVAMLVPVVEHRELALQSMARIRQRRARLRRAGIQELIETTHEGHRH